MGKNNRRAFECKDGRECFARLVMTGNCAILEGNENLMTGEVTAPYEPGKCPFRKVNQGYRNGVYYATPRDLKLPKDRRR